jgi:hypothetical protein
MEGMDIRKLGIRAGILATLLVVALLARYLVLGNTTLVRLKPDYSLAGQVSQSLGVNGSGSLWVSGRDYAIDERYFDNNDWVIVSINPTNKHTFQAALEVYQKINGSYRLELGPGEVFSSDQVANVAADVAAYLSFNGAVYGQPQ